MTHFMAAFAVALTFALQSANAQDDVGRFYLGGSIGQTKIDDDFCDVLIRPKPNCDNKDTSAKLYGGYNIHKNFAVEIGYIDFGEYQMNLSIEDRGTYSFSRTRLTLKQSINSFFFAGIGKINVHPKITLFGKIGLHRWNTHTEWVFTNFGMWNGLGIVHNWYDNQGSTVDSKDTDYFYGIGGEVAPFSNQKIKLRMEYEMFEFDGNRYLDFLSLGVTYTF